MKSSLEVYTRGLIPKPKILNSSACIAVAASRVSFLHKRLAIRVAHLIGSLLQAFPWHAIGTANRRRIPWPKRAMFFSQGRTESFGWAADSEERLLGGIT
jgi:hypothetical protein